jgi:hypothetical protein
MNDEPDLLRRFAQSLDRLSEAAGAGETPPSDPRLRPVLSQIRALRIEAQQAAAAIERLLQRPAP